MSLSEQINSDLKTAMKESDKVALSTLRMLKSSLKYKEIEKGGSLTDDEVISVLSSLMKQRKDSIEQFSKGGREDLASSERAEVEVLKRYLPEQIPEEELGSIILDTIKELNASGPKDVGKVMKAVMAKVKGRADGKIINAKVSQHLSA